MKTKINTLLTLFSLITLFFSCSESALTPKQAIKKMSPGINIGNILESPEEGSWNKQTFKEQFFSDFAEAGYKSVRIPITWGGHTAKEHPYKVDEKFLQRIEEIVDWGLQQGLILVINAHHENWFKEDCSPKNIERFDSIWSQIAYRFRDKSENLWFEPLNEPRTLTHEGLTQEQVDEMNTRIISIIRKFNKTRMVMYSGGGWGHEGNLMSTKRPDDPYILASYHSYNPWPFAGEAEGTWGSEEDLKAIEAVFDEVKGWSDTNNVEMVISEWGAIKYCDFNSRMKHYYEYSKHMRRINYAGMTWDDGSGFNLYNRRTGKWNPFINDIIVNSTMTSPSHFKTILAEDSTSVNLEWKNNTAYDSIVVEKCEKHKPFETITSLNGSKSSFVDDKISLNKKYYFRLAGYKNGNRLSCYPLEVSLLSY